MFALEVLQSCRTQWKALLKAIGGIDPSDTTIMSFDSKHSESYVSHSLAFQIIARCLGKNIFQTMIDEGTTTCIISLSCCNDLGSP